MGVLQVFESLQQNRFIFEKISTRDNRGSTSFLNNFNKTALLFTKFQLVIIGAVQVFESLQQNSFIF